MVLVYQSTHCDAYHQVFSPAVQWNPCLSKSRWPIITHRRITFLVACTQLGQHIVLVRWLVMHFSGGFCITAPAQSNETNSAIHQSLFLLHLHIPVTLCHVMPWKVRAFPTNGLIDSHYRVQNSWILSCQWGKRRRYICIYIYIFGHVCFRVHHLYTTMLWDNTHDTSAVSAHRWEYDVGCDNANLFSTTADRITMMRFFLFFFWWFCHHHKPSWHKGWQ